MEKELPPMGELARFEVFRCLLLQDDGNCSTAQAAVPLWNIVVEEI
jgi:hypothetical protein